MAEASDKLQTAAGGGSQVAASDGVIPGGSGGQARAAASAGEPRAASAANAAPGGRAQAGIGVYLLEIGRMERALRRHPGVKVRLFSDEERAWCEATARPQAHYAELVAARGAVVKALGAGVRSVGEGKGANSDGPSGSSECPWSDTLLLREVSVARDDAGRPHAELTGRLAELAAAHGVREVALSLSNTHEVAVANAVAVTDELRPQVDDTPDPAEELRATFRAARTVLDELERFQSGTS